MPGVPPAPDELGALRVANARLREVIEVEDFEVGTLGAVIRTFGAQMEELRAETGFRVVGKLVRVHSASSGKYALITVHGNRGRAGMDAAGVLPA